MTSIRALSLEPRINPAPISQPRSDNSLPNLGFAAAGFTPAVFVYTIHSYRSSGQSPNAG